MLFSHEYEREQDSPYLYAGRQGIARKLAPPLKKGREPALASFSRYAEPATLFWLRQNVAEPKPASAGTIIKTVQKDGFYYGRGDRIRTCDPAVPNRVRYQLRYSPKFRSKLLFQS